MKVLKELFKQNYSIQINEVGPAGSSIKANILIWSTSPYCHIHYICGKLPGWMTITEVTKEKLVEHAPAPNSCLHQKSLPVQKIFTTKTNHHRRCRHTFHQPILGHLVQMYVSGHWAFSTKPLFIVLYFSPSVN